MKKALREFLEWLGKLGALFLLIVYCALMNLAGAAEAGDIAASDSRADVTGLPVGEKPWWPSRYGADDQLGTLNEITPAVVQAATALVRTGRVVDLGRVLDESTPKFP